MYWQNSKFRSDFAEKIQVVIQSSRILCNFTAIEIENSIFRACQHDSDVYFQQIYDLTIYIKKQKNFEYLTQDVINNPTVALRKLIDNAESSLSVAQTRTSSTVTQERTSSSARARVLPAVQTRALSTAAHSLMLPSTQTRVVSSVNPRVSSAQHRVLPPTQTRVLSSQQQRTSRTETRVLSSAEPRSTSALLTAEPSVSSAAHSRILPSTQTRVVSSVNPRVSSAQHRVLPPTQTRVLSSQQQRTSRTETRVLSSAEPRSTSALLDPVLSDKDHYNLLKARLRSDLASFKETLVVKDILRSSWQSGDQNFRTNPALTDQYANPKLEDRSCSDVCYKEFKKVAKLLRKCPSTDSNCKMCINRSSIAVPANAVLYSCGHNFLCHGCAVSYWNKGKSCGCEGCLVNSKVVCPICKVAIKDVIKSYSPF